MSLFNSLLPAFTQPKTLNGTSANSPASNAAEHLPPRVPVHTLHENADGYSLDVHLPGVTKDGLSVTAENGVLTIEARRAWSQPEGWTSLHRESTDAGYRLSLEYAEAIDADKISASLTDGVLRLTLPKHEARKPRKITVA